MSKSNTRFWDALGKTDPKHTKGFKRAGGFSGTALKPIWIVQRLTETFGPVGEGWGMEEPQFTLVHANDGEVLVYCHVRCWHTNPGQFFYGVGGDKVITKRSSGQLFQDDEAFKKAFTDAVNNAFKFVGVGADVHMGQFDDSKYVDQVAAEFQATAKVEAVAELDEFKAAIDAATTLEQLDVALAKYRPAVDRLAKTNAAQVAAARQHYSAKKGELTKALEPA
ncbi:MAG: hypothetical protein LW689_04435 [Novosphingobium sp.]|jgi:hypothetical protein|nr:hypothetical protein [Novosphingobium sp.]MCE2842032.1 hypothetical protein [Novosphingobium sp.]